ncbi:MAG TPA: penicillin-binding transpeptidase domain-containing protein [Candidatus Obscuribacterales bacterium]
MPIQRIVVLLTSTLMMLSPISPSQAATLTANEFERIFQGYQGAFILYDVEKNKTLRYNERQCNEPISPCSTFKIFNALVSLDAGVVKDEGTKLKWDGKKHDREELNKDHTLKSAMATSAVWYFQCLAGTLGKERMQRYLNRLHYGNEDMSSGLTTFWLGEDNSLKISPNEQVKFISKLAAGELPVSKRSMTITKEIIKLKECNGAVLYGKTGTDGKGGKLTLGWFVGFVRKGGHDYVFATNIKSEGGNAMGRTARAMTEQILHKMELI